MSQEENVNADATEEDVADAPVELGSPPKETAPPVPDSAPDTDTATTATAKPNTDTSTTTTTTNTTTSSRGHRSSSSSSGTGKLIAKGFGALRSAAQGAAQITKATAGVVGSKLLKQSSTNDVDSEEKYESKTTTTARSHKYDPSKQQKQRRRSNSGSGSSSSNKKRLWLPNKQIVYNEGLFELYFTVQHVLFCFVFVLFSLHIFIISFVLCVVCL